MSPSVGEHRVQLRTGGAIIAHPFQGTAYPGVSANLSLLLYFKYTGFLFGSLDEAFGLGWTLQNITLPLAISFFTFQQIAYLVDTHDGEVVEHDFVNYCLFITFFRTSSLGPLPTTGKCSSNSATATTSGRDWSICPSAQLFSSWACSRK